MALHDEVLREVLAGRVPWRFKTRDLKRPAFLWHGNGEYELILTPSPC